MRAPLRPTGLFWPRPGLPPSRPGRVPWRASDFVIAAITATLIATLLVHIARLILAPGAGQAVQHAAGLRGRRGSP